MKNGRKKDGKNRHGNSRNKEHPEHCYFFCSKSAFFIRSKRWFYNIQYLQWLEIECDWNGCRRTLLTAAGILFFIIEIKLMILLYDSEFSRFLGIYFRLERFSCEFLILELNFFSTHQTTKEFCYSYNKKIWIKMPLPKCIDSPKFYGNGFIKISMAILKLKISIFTDYLLQNAKFSSLNIYKQQVYRKPIRVI